MPENEYTEKRRIRESTPKTIFRYSLYRKKLIQEHGMSGVKSAEMNRKKSQKENAHHNTENNGRLTVFPVYLPYFMKSQICSAGQRREKRGISQDKTAEPETPYKIRGAPFQKVRKAKTKTKRENIRKNPAEPECP